MRFRVFSLILIVASLLVNHANAQDVAIKRSSVIENYKGKPYYIHFVKQGETLSGISKAYNVTIEELNADNPALDKGLKADMVLKIPQKAQMEVPEIDVPKKENTAVKPKTDKPEATAKPQADPGYIIYQVKKQETLYGISKQFNVTVDDILKMNPGFDSLKAGMDIKIPKKKTADNVNKTEAKAPETKTEAIAKPAAAQDEILVKSGETLYSIAKNNNTSIDNLIDLNPQLKDGLKAGMVLKLHKPVVNGSAKPDIRTETSADIKPVVPSNCYSASNLNKTYNIALLLPFLLDEASDVLEAPELKKTSDFENFNYFQFYAGFMLAADSLEKYGLQANIQVLDADKLNDTLTIRQALRKPGMDKMNLMVGPVYANSFAVAARYARKHEIGIVNPLSRRENIVDGNPYVFKAQVSAAGIATKLTAFIADHYPNANIISVRNDAKEYKAAADQFEAQVKSRIAAHTLKASLQTATFTTDQMAGITKKIKPGVKNIVIFFSNNKSSVPNFVSLLNPRSKTDDIILVGMDGWEDFELETEFLVNLNYHQLTSSYINYDSEAVRQFITRFRNKYGAVPVSAKHAFLGYDLGWYFLTSLMWYGDDYLKCIPANAGHGLQFNFDFSAADKNKGSQNQHVDMVKLVDYKMMKTE